MKPLDAATRSATLRELREVGQHVQGWLHALAGDSLYDLVARTAPGDRFVELGSWKGLSTLFMAAGVRDRGRGMLHAVDTWQGTASEDVHARMLEGYGPDQLYREFLANLERARVAPQVEPLRMTTREAALQWRHGTSIGVLHIDAGHEYEDVREEFELWSPLVLPGGFIVFDDVPSWAGPSRVYSELPRWWMPVGVVPNKVIVQKAT